MSKIVRRVALAVVVTLIAAACGSSGDSGDDSSGTTVPAEKIDYKAIGLWDDGPCDPAKPPLKLGLMTVFESPVLSLKEQATALKASAKAFNGWRCQWFLHSGHDMRRRCERRPGGRVRPDDRQGRCCRDGERHHHRGSGDVSKAMAEAKIPRVAPNLSNEDWADPNAYPLDASSTGSVLVLPQALIQEGIKKIGVIRVDLAAASALVGIMKQIYGDDGATFPYDVPVPAGTTDYSQFLLGADRAGTEGVVLAIGEQEAVQVVEAGQQVSTQQVLGAVARHVLPQVRVGARRLRRQDGVHLVVPAGDRGPPRVPGVTRRPRRVGRRQSPAGEPQVQSDALVDRPLCAAPRDPRRQDDGVHPRRDRLRCCSRRRTSRC